MFLLYVGNLLYLKMKLLTRELLEEYGFTLNRRKTTPEKTVLTKDNFDVVIKSDGIYYSNMGFDYPLKDNDILRKMYFEVRREKLVVTT